MPFKDTSPSRAASLPRLPSLGSALSLLSGVLIWELAVRLGLLPAQLFPAPTAVAAAMLRGFSSGAIQAHLLVTLGHLAAGFSAGCAAGIALGMACAAWKPLDKAVNPWVNATLPIPQVALLPLFMLLLGAGDGLCVLAAAFGAFYNVFIAVRAGVLRTPRSLVEAARNLGGGPADVLFKVTVPAALPYLLVGMHLGLLQSLLLVIVVEGMTAMKGMGYMIWLSGEWLQVESYYAYLAVLAALGMAIVFLFGKAVRLLAPWAGNMDDPAGEKAR